ncbi:MAG: hypothetical protein ABJB01_00215 [Rudaea sp.]
MELDDLKMAWQALDRHMQKQSALNTHIFREQKLHKVSVDLRWFYWGKVAQILFGDALIYFGILCTMRYLAVPHLLICSVSMLVYGVLVVVLGGLTLGWVSRIDYAAPVVQIQKRVSALHRFQIIANLCAGLPWWFLWIAIFILEVKANLGVDLIVTAPGFIGISIAVGMVGLVASIWFYRRSRGAGGSRMSSATVPRRLRDAKNALDEIAQFESV